MQDDVKNFEANLKASGLRTSSREVAKSLGGMKLGQVYFFDYESQRVGGIMVATAKHSKGFFVAKKTKNTLVCMIKVNENAESEVTTMVIKNLAGRRKSATYSKTQEGPSAPLRTLSRFFGGLKSKVKEKIALSVFGKDNFRTYNWAKMKNITSIVVN